MSHTSGKWKFLRSKRKHKQGLLLYTDAFDLPDGFIGKTYGFGIHDEIANAERICHCVNNFDMLVKALEDALAIADDWVHDQLDGTTSLKGALAELEPMKLALSQVKRRMT